MILQKVRDFFIGLPRNPFDLSARKHVALAAFWAWIGLGADGLSSSCYGPSEAFLALGQYNHMAVYLAILTALTVFIISVSYNQVIELFPSGGGGYKVASKLIGPYAGLVSGAALIVDYVLTIAISVASGVDALFSLLPPKFSEFKIHFEAAVIVILLILNLRGMKESIKVLMPIFFGFVVTHFGLILYGIFSHGEQLPTLLSSSVQDTRDLFAQSGWFFGMALLLRAYSLGGGTYTGLEAVSNNINHLREPRIKTGKWTMFYMATSLSFTAGGIILLYLLWEVVPVPNETLNATVFNSILSPLPLHHFILLLVLMFEAGLLFVAANTGFLGGPAVLANMAMDEWMPKRFRNLSNRLVTQNGIVWFGIFALFILLWTDGKVSMLVVLYSMNVFLTFSLSLLGLCIYWIKSKHRRVRSHWKSRLALSAIGFAVCSGILIITLLEKFTSGGWMTVLITSGVIFLCLVIKKHYTFINRQSKYLDDLLKLPLNKQPDVIPEIDIQQPTAVFLIGESIGQGMHTLLWVHRMFPKHFKNFIFLSAGVVDVGSYGSEIALSKMKHKIEQQLDYFVKFSHEHSFAALGLAEYGNDPVKILVDLAEKVSHEYLNCVFFASSLVSKQDNWFNRRLHSDTAMTLQRYLHLRGLQMVILPVKLER